MSEPRTLPPLEWPFPVSPASPVDTTEGALHEARVKWIAEQYARNLRLLGGRQDELVTLPEKTS
jgi:hypothetical protein